jgi:hypothetical protein
MTDAFERRKIRDLDSRMKWDVNRVIGELVDAQDKLQGIVVVMKYKDGSTDMVTSAMSMETLAFLQARIQARLYKEMADRGGE